MMDVTEEEKERWINDYNEKRKWAIEEIEELVVKSEDKRFSFENRDLMKERIKELVKRYNILYSDIKL